MDAGSTETGRSLNVSDSADGSIPASARAFALGHDPTPPAGLCRKLNAGQFEIAILQLVTVYFTQLFFDGHVIELANVNYPARGLLDSTL